MKNTEQNNTNQVRQREIRAIREDLDDVKMRLQHLEKIIKAGGTVSGSEIIELREKIKQLELRLTQLEQTTI
jgi:ElaB/YqjD/DUF883 family membrane-anchored ribosome-binding protein